MLGHTTLAYNFNFKYLSLTTNVERQKSNRQKMHAFTVFFLSMLNNRDCSFILFYPFRFISLLFFSFLFFFLLFTSFIFFLSNLEQFRPKLVWCDGFLLHKSQTTWYASNSNTISITLCICICRMVGLKMCKTNKLTLQ